MRSISHNAVQRDARERGETESFDAFFQSIRSLTSVCYRASEARDEQLQRLLSELPGAGVAVVDLDAYDDFRELPVVPRETLLLAGSRETLLLAQGTPMATVGYGALAVEPEGEGELGRESGAGEGHVSERQKSGISGEETEEPECAALSREAEQPGCSVPDDGGTEYYVPTGQASDGAAHADLLVEGFEEVDVQLLDRIMKRAQGLPWVTAVTRRCVLREITPGDLDALFALYAQPGITDYTQPLYERKKEEQYTRDYIANMYRFYGYGMWLVFSRESGALIGRAGFSHADLGDEIVLEMGYIVGVPYQRQGYATEICERLIGFARANLSDFGTLNCFVEPGNAASRGLMDKLSFADSGTVEIKGKEMVRYTMDL